MENDEINFLLQKRVSIVWQVVVEIIVRDRSRKYRDFRTTKQDHWLGKGAYKWYGDDRIREFKWTAFATVVTLTIPIRNLVLRTYNIRDPRFSHPLHRSGSKYL